MTQDQFQIQLNRLVEQFGKSAYGTERCRIIWREVQAFDLSWLTKTIDKFIGECRQPPLMPEFREEIAKERERLWSIEKKQHAREAHEFSHSSYGPEDMRTICQTIIKRLQDGVSDEDYASFHKMLNNVAVSSPGAK